MSGGIFPAHWTFIHIHICTKPETPSTESLTHGVGFEMKGHLQFGIQGALRLSYKVVLI